MEQIYSCRRVNLAGLIIRRTRQTLSFQEASRDKNARITRSDCRQGKQQVFLQLLKVSAVSVFTAVVVLTAVLESGAPLSFLFVG